jgi:hypothetical protein
MIEVMLDSALVGLRFAALLLGWALLTLLVIRFVSGSHRRAPTRDPEPVVIEFDERLARMPVAGPQALAARAEPSGGEGFLAPV